MSYKLKRDSVQGFSKKVSELVCDNFYGSHERVDGNALMGLTDSKQVNAFLVKGLFEQWQKETENLRSPFFDFEHKDVKEALTKFMNVVSEHISIGRTDLEPLLEQAVAETVLITFDPVTFVRKTIKESGSLSKKYIKTRKSSFKNLKSLSGVSADDFEQDPPISPEDFVNTFGVDVEDLFEAESLSFFDRLEETDDEELTANNISEVEEKETIVETYAPETDSQPEPEPEPEPEPIAAATPLVADQADEAETINDRFNGNGKVETLADKLQKGKKKSIEASLNLNEKFMFINSLFEGDKDKLSTALSDLEQAENYEEAKMKAYKYSESWDMESEEVTSFFEVIERRFS